MNREENKRSDICKKYLELIGEFYDRYSEFEIKYEKLYQKTILVLDQRDEYKQKYEKLCNDIINIQIQKINKN